MLVILSRCERREEKRPKDDGDSQQFNGREGETATLYKRRPLNFTLTLAVSPHVISTVRQILVAL